MDKQEIINALNELKEGGADIAEVIVHISNAGKTKYENESLLVRLVDKPSNEDSINNAEHWDLFDSIEDFKANAYYKEGANDTYCIDYISEFISVNKFVTDFQQIREAV